MKISSTPRLSLILALLFSIITGILIFITKLTDKTDFVAYTIFSVLLSFLILYVALYYTFNALIINKIKPLFDTVSSLQLTSDDIQKNIDDGELLENIEKKVMIWSKSKIDEIAFLKANEKYRKEFLGNVSHELKTPLFNIQGYILTLLDGGIHDKKINIKYLERTEKNINRLISVVEDLETISKLESGEIQLNIETFDIIKLILEVFEMQEIRANKKNIKLNFYEKYKKPVFVKADKKGIFDVISNLVINSIIYGKENGKTIIKIEEKNKTVLIQIEDDGIGISENNLQRIFERFYRVDTSRSKIQGGTGLGLSIVKHMLEVHKQKITVKSKFGEGSSFSFSLNQV
ncbi:MAG: ATP-binding protein [Bacteroidales bacterium]|nr:ATP-binding protein [Bacteroidales bacterium]MBN2755922.1 ATP-binding protein [Bacteroidales bacterium]